MKTSTFHLQRISEKNDDRYSSDEEKWATAIVEEFINIVRKRIR